MSGCRGWLLRRFVVAPLMPLLAFLAAAVWAFTLLGSAVVCPLLALLRGDAPRWRLLRAVSFAVLYLVEETLCLLLCLVLWLASGAGRGIRAGPFVRAHRAHRALLGCFLGLLVAAARPIFGFRLIVEWPCQLDVAPPCRSDVAPAGLLGALSPRPRPPCRWAGVFSGAPARRRR